MMKWGRKKNIPTSSSSPSSSSRPSLISHAFPKSWLSRFKNVEGSSKPEEANVKGNGKKSSGSPSAMSCDRLNGGQFYGQDGDSYWSLSFRKERLEGEMGRCGLKSVRYDSDDELHGMPARTMKTTGGEGSQKYNDLVSERRKARELEVLQRNFGCKAKVDSGKAELRTRRRRALKDQKSRKENRRIWEEERESQRETDQGSVNSTESVEKDVFEVKPVRVTQATDENNQKPIVSDSRRQHSISFSNSIDLRTIKEDCLFEALSLEQSNTFSDSELSSEWQKQKINEMKLRSENQKTSLHLSKERQRRRTKQSRKVKACSPRSAVKIECKIKALEDMKRARIEMKKMTKEGAVKDTTNFDSFAVVKCSVNPEEDFKHSMIEMIKEKGIRQPEELEELLACYLTLNADEYHDLIVKVFREVWFELNQAHFHEELEFINCCYN